ncbi:hypothetical protein [Rubricoccus marinus]|uniref:hypothetical protein n=1 Tax=Rubricoccus marinus TaxID=716817 RepID=UPI0015C5B92D|nr:hypothetical protein [Rubricoccus marinus]
MTCAIEERIGGRFRFRTLLFQSARNPPEVIVEGAFHAPVVDEQPLAPEAVGPGR